MQRKAENEFKQLIKIGVPENMAHLIVTHKYKLNEEEVENSILDIKDEQLEIKKELDNFVELSKNIEMVKKIEDKNLISNNNINTNDKNEDKII